MRGFLVKLENRPDGVTNQSINSYSTMPITMSQYYTACASAVASTTFTNVFVMVLDQNGNIYEQRNIITQYVPPEPEPEPEEPEGEGEGENEPEEPGVGLETI